MTYSETNKKRELEVGKRKEGSPGIMYLCKANWEEIYKGSCRHGIQVCGLWGKWVDTGSHVWGVWNILVCCGRTSSRADRGLVMLSVEVRKGCLGSWALCVQGIPSFNSHLLKIIINYLLDYSSLNSLNE